MLPIIHYLTDCVIKLLSVIRARCLRLRPGILVERVAREGCPTRSAYLEIVLLFLRNRAPAGTTAQFLSVEDRL
jgi:hypothetical protein